MPKDFDAILPVNGIDDAGIEPVQPSEVSSSSVDGYDTGHPFQDWWHRVSDGWNNFWSNIVGIYGNTNGLGAGLSGAPTSISDPMSANEIEGNMNQSQVDDISPIANETGDPSSLETDLSSAITLSNNYLTDYLKNNPNATAEEAMKYMSTMSDEWAEKYIDYMIEKQSIDEQNAYTASREDTAYQRLVNDLKSAGLNPALLYGNSASTSSAGSVGHVSMSSGANSRAVNNYSKLKNLLLAYLVYSWNKDYDTGDMILKYISKFAGIAAMLA